MITNNLSIGSVVKFMGLVGIVTRIETHGEKTLLEIDTPKRIALHQKNADVVEYDEDMIETRSTIDLLEEFQKWFMAKDFTGIETPEIHALVIGYKDALDTIESLQRKCSEYRKREYEDARKEIVERSNREHGKNT